MSHMDDLNALMSRVNRSGDKASIKFVKSLIAAVKEGDKDAVKGIVHFNRDQSNLVPASVTKWLKEEAMEEGIRFGVGGEQPIGTITVKFHFGSADSKKIAALQRIVLKFGARVIISAKKNRGIGYVSGLVVRVPDRAMSTQQDFDSLKPIKQQLIDAIRQAGATYEDPEGMWTRGHMANSYEPEGEEMSEQSGRMASIAAAAKKIGAGSKPSVKKSGSFAAYFKTRQDSTFATNAARFATKEEAEAYAQNLFMRWLGASEWKVEPHTDAPNYVFANGQATPMPKKEEVDVDDATIQEDEWGGGFQSSADAHREVQAGLKADSQRERAKTLAAIVKVMRGEITERQFKKLTGHDYKEVTNPTFKNWYLNQIKRMPKSKLAPVAPKQEEVDGDGSDAIQEAVEIDGRTRAYRNTVMRLEQARRIREGRGRAMQENRFGGLYDDGSGKGAMIPAPVDFNFHEAMKVVEKYRMLREKKKTLFGAPKGKMEDLNAAVAMKNGKFSMQETELSPKQKEYRAFFAKALKKFGHESPADMDDAEKKKFFNWVEKNWKG